MIAEIITWWVNVGDGIDMHLPKDHNVDLCTDNSGEQIPVSAPVVVSVELSQSVLDEIINDPNYGDGSVLWDSPNPKPPDGIPNAAEFGLLRAFLAKPPIAMSQAEISAAIGSNPNGRTRLEISNDLSDWIRNR